MQQPNPCICTTPIPQRASSSLATSLFQWGPYPPGAGELGTVEQVDKYLETAISPDSWAHCWLYRHSHKTREGKHSQKTKKTEQLLHFADQKLLAIALKYTTVPFPVHILIQAALLLLSRMTRQTIFYRPYYSRQYHEPLSNHVQPEDSSPRPEVTDTQNTAKY